MSQLTLLYAFSKKVNDFVLCYAQCTRYSLAQVSYTFCKELITVLLKNMKSEEIWPASSLIEALDKVRFFLFCKRMSYFKKESLVHIYLLCFLLFFFL